ncbi:2-amino-4-hydroxy-6-hydroxymethyldihydropteridine diphosphokinase [Maribacter polysiphoniae]|uniref:2-amino-4-hydroxy-6-hydroxymethyldihydropteridine pyrophosphokinase n=1 Tax=Maribacter polysiphoniae TaxID=429344 RepID=A0A316E6X6_9FLAO|nr:2-amino-4-hydroxy-6-hydroxymethyldihydropteridine diphosphokinase [Maribacter polysiphoniae]MBD1259554.1 2-amino-4-hydroxy-6-hydroxymethyldihydropteridine diphosphokinase [Maribacter polysiphoniae]PWK25119.1 2-amino-4-hydroxy-6-hydroxymethyldihydropteridine diphosphokinase [Maribacter polysiphoniae]
MNELKKAYISIGSNLGNRLQNLQNAIFLLDAEVGRIPLVSKVYESESWGFDADDFLNACIVIETYLTPQEVLGKIFSIEKKLGRERGLKNGYASRTIDIDIIYFEKEILQTDELTIPHPNLRKRKFVLLPLADIAPQFYHPIYNKDTRNLIQECKDQTRVEKTKLKLYKTKKELFASLNFMAIEGNIGAGKTTLAHKIAEDFNGKLVLERFADNPFLPKFYEDQGRYAFPLEMSFLADRYQQFTDDTSQFDLFKNFMVSDYDIYKSLIFAQVTLQSDEFNLYRKLFNLMYKEVQKPRIYVYLYQSTERLLENIKKRGRTYEQSIESTYLDKINKGYFDFFKSYPEQNTLIIDVGDLDFVAHQQDYDAILGKIQDFAIDLKF